MKKNKIKTGSRFWVALILGILLCTMLCGGTGIAAEDAPQSGKQVFDIDAKLLGLDNRRYDIQLTLGNRGDDWEGTVRVQMDIRYDSLSCAYDTALSLPQGSTKQFVVSIPVGSIEEQDETLKVSLLDQKGNAIAEKNYKRFLMGEADALSMGILSDTYLSLTYLDLGGELIYYDGNGFPINLTELDQDTLVSSLDFLQILVIDNYNTGIFTEEEQDSILQWVRAGGMLIVGTGERAEDTLSGLDFLSVKCIQVNEPGESNYNEDYGAGLEKLSLAELADTTDRYYMDSESLTMASSWGYGAVEFVPYALSDLGRSDLMIEDWGNYARDILQNINNYVNVLHNYQYNDTDYLVGNIFKSLGNGGSSLSFGALKLIVILYAVFAGPVLYLILRAMKKRDWYWAAVPISALVGILLIYIAGRGFEVVNTRVHSVTVEKLSGNDAGNDSGSGSVTYLHCYDAGHKEWGLQLADRYDYAGPVFSSYFYGDPDEAYHYHIRREGDRVFFGMDPDSGFEDAYFVAGTVQNLETGSITSNLTVSAGHGITGTVTNGTSRDFQYFAIMADDTLFVYGNLPAGETCTLGKTVYASGSAANVVSDFVYDYANDHKKDYDVAAALGTGILEMRIREKSLDGPVIIGITKDWDKAADDDCTETAYGCLYAVQ